MTHICFFQTCCQHHIKQDARNQIRKICRRQCHKSQHSTKCSKWNDRQHSDSCKCHQRQWCRCMALNKRKFWCADHMDDQSLAPHRFDKPSRLKHCNISRLHPYQICAGKMTGKIIVQHSLETKSGQNTKYIKI